MAAYLNIPVENHSKSLELRFVLLVTQRNVAFSFTQEITSFKKKLPNNPILNRVCIGKTNTSNVIGDGIGNKIKNLQITFIFYFLYNSSCRKVSSNLIG
jgi:hypothetical protein